MKFVLPRDVAISLFKRVNRVQSNSTAVPNLEKVHVSAADGQVFVSKTNLTHVARVWHQADVQAFGTAIFPSAPTLIHFLSALPDLPVEFDCSDGVLVVRCGTTRLTRAVISTKAYPQLPDFNAITQYEEIAVGPFSSDLAAVTAVAANSKVPAGKQVQIANGVLTAADEFRVHAQQMSGYTLSDRSLPASALPLLKALILTSEHEYVHVGAAKGAVVFKTHDAILVAYHTEVSLPSVGEVLQKAALSNDRLVVVDTEALVRAIGQVLGTASKDVITLAIEQSGVVSVSSVNEVGDTFTQFKADVVPDGPVEFIDQISLSGTMLSDVLKVYPSQSLRMWLQMPTKKMTHQPVRFSGEGEGGKFVAVLPQVKKELL